LIFLEGQRVQKKLEWAEQTPFSNPTPPPPPPQPKIVQFMR